MSEIKINIRQSGNTAGTSKWLAEQVAGAEFKFGKNQSGNFSIFAKWPWEGSFYTIAFKYDETDQDWKRSYYDWHKPNWCVKLASPNDEDMTQDKSTVFKDQLTPSARASYYKVLNKLINECEKWINSDQEVEFDVSVTPKSTTNE